jgi:hypothetical protein
MSNSEIRTQLVQAGLHEESVDRLINHYTKMRRYLREENYDDVGNHVGNFCENVVNILRDFVGLGVEDHPDLDTFVNEITGRKYDPTGLDYETQFVLPHTLRAAYDLRDRRDSVHVNLEIPVNHSDQQTAVRQCSWILAELVRYFGDKEDLDEIRLLIEELARPVSSLYEDKRVYLIGKVEKILPKYITIDTTSGDPLVKESYYDLTGREQFIAQLLFYSTKNILGELDGEKIGRSSDELASNMTVSSSDVMDYANQMHVVDSDPKAGGYYIQESKIVAAVQILPEPK